MSSFLKATGGLAAAALIAVLGATQDVCSWNIEGSGDWTRVTDDCVDENNRVVPCPDAGAAASGAVDAGPVTTPASTEVEITSRPTYIGAGDELALTAVVRNASAPGVVWALVGSSKGTLNGATGAYTAPSYAASPGTNQINAITSVTVRATSIGDDTKFDTLTFSVLPYRIVVTPARATLNPGGTVDFDGKLEGDPTDSTQSRFVWYVAGGGGSVGVGSGVFTAGSTTGTATVRCTSVLHPGYTVLVPVTITNAALVAVDVQPSQATLVSESTDYPGDDLVLVPTVTNATDDDVSWELVSSPPSGTAFEPSSGVVTSGSTAGSFVIRARSVQDPSKYDDVTVNIVDRTTAWRITGTVTRVSPSDSGPIYVTIDGRLKGATVADGSTGKYELTAAFDPDASGTNATIRAWRDHDDVGRFIEGVHDTATISITALPTTAPTSPTLYSGKNLTLLAPSISAMTTCPEPSISIAPMGTAALVNVRTDLSSEDERSPMRHVVKVYAGATATGTPAQTKTLAAGLNDLVVFKDLAANTQYTFQAVAEFHTSSGCTGDSSTSDAVTVDRLDLTTGSGQVTVRAASNVEGALSTRASSGTASLVVVEASSDMGSSSGSLGAARTALTPTATSATLDIPAREPGHRLQVHLVDANDDGLFRPGEPYSAMPSGGGGFADFPVEALTTTATATGGILSLPAYGPPTDDVVARAIFDGSLATETTLVLDARSNRRYVRKVTITAGPSIAGLTYPFSLLVKADGRFEWRRKFASSLPTGSFTFQFHFADGSTRIATRGLTAAAATPSTPAYAGAATTNYLWVACDSVSPNPACTANLAPVSTTSPPSSASAYYRVKAHASGDLRVTSDTDPTVKIQTGTTGAFGAALTRPQTGGFTVASELSVQYGLGGGIFANNELWDVRHTFARVSATPTFTWSSTNTGDRLVELAFVRAGDSGGLVTVRRVSGGSVSIAVPEALGLTLWEDYEVRVREFVAGHVSARPAGTKVTVGL